MAPSRKLPLGVEMTQTPTNATKLSGSAHRCGAQVLRMFAQEGGEVLRLFGGQGHGAGRVGHERIAAANAQIDVPSDGRHRGLDASIGKPLRRSKKEGWR